MGGKTQTSTQAVTIPPSVLSQYNSVNALAQQTAQTPFQQYSQNPNAFVAPINSTQQAGIDATNQYAQTAQPYFDAATGQLVAAQNATSPYYGQATTDVGQAQAVGSGLAGASLGSLQGANAAAAPGQAAAAANYGAAYQNAQPYNEGALTSYLGGLSAAQPLQSSAASNITGAQSVGTGLANASLGSLSNANATADPIQYGALGQIEGSAAAAQPYNAAATSAYTGAQAAGSALNDTAASGYTGALNAAQPYNAAATSAAIAGAGAVDPSTLDAASINQYLSPYLSQVLGSTANVLNQNNQQQQAGQLGNAISSGAFGGDRAGIAAANLEEQQNLANANIYSGIENTGYNTALSTAQQQQGVGLAAGQANRAAVQNASTQLQGLGQQEYAQGTGTAAQQAALGQQEYGQLSTTGQNLQSVGQQGFAQGQTAATNAAGIGATLFGQGATTAAQQAALGEQQFSQGLSAAGQQQSLGQQEFGQGQTVGTNLQGLGSTINAQGNALGSAQQGLANQEFGQGATTAAQQAALSQQQFGQGITASGQTAALGQDIYGTGAATSAALGQLGTGAQASGLSGAQAQLAAGTAAQQTTQAGDTALYNQFLQQQSYPFQVDQFLANVAEGTGALSGSTTTTTQPQSIFSDERLKDDITPVGKTFDGQDIMSYRYKGGGPKRLGLLAQDVERDHPEAVGLAGGFKTVDYDKATADAAKRGHFRAGGLAAATNDNREGFAFGGYSSEYAPAYGTYGYPSYQSNGQSYGPFSQGGLYGAQSGAAPRGGASYVPQATLPVGRLAVAGGLAPQRSMLDSATEAANLVSQVNKGANSPEAQSMFKQLSGMFGGNQAASAVDDPGSDANAVMDYASDVPFKRGGHVRSGLAAGGQPIDPYADPGSDTSLDIPDTPQQGLSLALPGAPPKAQSDNIFSDLADVAKIGTEIASVAKRGGRQMRAAGGLATPPQGDLADADEQASMANLLKSGLAAPLAQQAPVQAPPGAGASPPAEMVTPPDTSAPPSATAGASLPTGLSSILAGIAKSEGTGKNPSSSARGPYQIIDPTFVGAYRQMFPDQAEGMSKQQILAIRNTPQGDQISSQMGPFLAKENIAALQKAGAEPTAPNVYLAHLLNPQAALKVINADPSAPLSQLLPAADIQANPSIMAGKSAGDLRSWATRLMSKNMPRKAGGRVGFADGGDPDVVPATDPNAAPASPADTSMATTAPSAPAADPDAPPMARSVEHDPGATPTQAPPAKSSILDDLKKPEVFIPILTGIAAAASTPTVHPLMAIAEGLGAGANAYQQQRQFGLEQQKVAQHGQEVGVYQGELGVSQQNAASSRIQAQASAQNAQNQAMTIAQQAFDANYRKTNEPGPDGFPMYIENSTGRKISQTDYGTARNNFLSTALRGYGQGNSPLTATAGLLTNGANNVGPSNGAGPGGLGGSGGIPAATGAPAAGTGAVPPVAGNAGPGGGAPAATVHHPQIAPQPVRHVAPTAPTNPKSVVSQKVASGAYMGPTIPMPSVDESRVAPASNPQLLIKQGQALVNNGDPDQAAQGQRLIERGQDILSGKEPAMGTDGQPYMGYAQVAQANEARNAVTQSYAGQVEAQNNASQSFSQQYPQNIQILNSLNRVYSESNPGRLTADWADLIGKIRSTPWLADSVTPQMQQLQDAQDEAHKDTARQAIVQAVAAGMASHAPAAALQQSNMTVPNPAMGAGARYNLVGQLLAQQMLSKDYYNDWNKNKGRVMDVSSYQNDWTNEHPISAYEGAAYDHLTPFPGMTSQEMLQHPRHPSTPVDLAGIRPGVPFVIPSGPNKGKIAYTTGGQ